MVVQNAEQGHVAPFQMPNQPPIGFYLATKTPGGMPTIRLPYPDASAQAPYQGAPAPVQIPPQPNQYPTVTAPYPVQSLPQPSVELHPPYNALFPTTEIN